MKVTERIIYILSIALLGFILCIKPNDGIIIERIPGDSVFTTITVDSLIPYDTTIYDTDTLWLPGDTVGIHDTVFIYNDYFKMYNYKVDTTISEVNIMANSQITQNRLYKQTFDIKNNRQTTIVNVPRNQFGVGGVIGLNLAAPVLTYQFKNNEVGLGYNFVNKGLVLQYQYKFSIK